MSAVPKWEETIPAWEDTSPIDGGGDATPKGDHSGVVEAMLRGPVQGLTAGWADEITGAGEHLLTGKPYEQARDESRANYKESAEAHPVVTTGGKFLGAAGSLVVPGLGEVNLAKMAALGALQGLGESESDNLTGMAKDTAMGAGTGAAAYGATKALAPVASKVGQMLSRVTKSGADALENVANSEARRAIGVTSADLTKNPEALEKMNQVGRTALDKGIIKNPITNPFSSSSSDMLERAAALDDETGARMGEFLKGQSAGARAPLTASAAPQLREQFLFDPQGLIDRLEELRPEGLNMGENAKLNAIIDHAIDTAKSRGTINKAGEYALRPIPWEQANALKSQLGGMAKWDNTLSNEANALKRRISGVAVDYLDKNLENAAVSRGGDAGREGFDQFLQDKKDWGASQTMQKTLTRQAGREEGNVSPGVRGTVLAAAELSHGNVPGAVVAAGGTKVANKYGRQFTATTADTLSKKLRAAPEQFGRFAAVLTNAAKRGTQSLAVTHMQLQQTSPEYRQMVTAMDGGH